MPTFDNFKGINSLAVGICSLLESVILEKTGAMIFNLETVLLLDGRLAKLTRMSGENQYSREIRLLCYQCRFARNSPALMATTHILVSAVLGFLCAALCNTYHPPPDQRLRYYR
jgi:hypothetical protein